jgi:adenylate cyclase, class 2
MGVEIEKKYRLSANSVDQLRNRLQEVNATYIKEELEENILFSGGALDQKPSVLRLRRIDNKSILTYKERYPSSSPIKHQREDETEIKDPQALTSILEALGFTPSLIYEKRRETWKLKRVEVTVDQLPFGLFMEIEGDEEGILETEQLLEMEHMEAEMATYPELAAQYGRRSLNLIEARFEK